MLPPNFLLDELLPLRTNQPAVEYVPHVEVEEHVDEKLSEPKAHVEEPGYGPSVKLLLEPQSDVLYSPLQVLVETQQQRR